MNLFSPCPVALLGDLVPAWWVRNDFWDEFALTSVTGSQWPTVVHHVKAQNVVLFHDDVIKWKNFPCYWPLVFFKISKNVQSNSLKYKALREYSLPYVTDLTKSWMFMAFRNVWWRGFGCINISLAPHKHVPKFTFGSLLISTVSNAFILTHSKMIYCTGIGECLGMHINFYMPKQSATLVVST